MSSSRTPDGNSMDELERCPGRPGTNDFSTKAIERTERMKKTVPNARRSASDAPRTNAALREITRHDQTVAVRHDLIRLERVAATTGVMSRATSSEKDGSRHRETELPEILPGMKLTGTNTAMIVAEVATTARPISSAASSAAWKPVLPMRLWRTMFSISTMASSTSTPATSDGEKAQPG